MTHRIAILPGDGVGREIVAQGVKAIKAAGQRFGMDLQLTEGLYGDAAREALGETLPPATLAVCRQAHAVLFGAHGGAVAESAYAPLDTQRFNLRGVLGLTINLRPVRVLEPLIDAAWLKPSRVMGTDYMIIRFGGQSMAPENNKRLLWRDPSGLRRALNTIGAMEEHVAPHLHLCFRLAQERRKKLALVVHDNVSETSQLWRQVGIEIGREYPDVELRHLVPDNFAHLLLRDPRAFDIVVMDHTLMAGMLNDQGAAIMGSLGMCPSGAFPVDLKRGLKGAYGMYEPIHGSVPHRAGKDEVNPIGTILSAAMLFHYSLDRPDVARAIEGAVVRALKGYRTYDIWQEGTVRVGTSRMGDIVAAEVLNGG